MGSQSIDRQRKSKSIIIYASYIPRCGGIETAIMELMKGLEGYSVSLVFTSAESWERLFGYARYGDVIQWLPDVEFEADVCLISSNHQLPENIKAKRVLQWVHSDYEKYNLDFKFNPQVDTYVAVSKHSSRIFRKLYKDIIKDRKVEVIYNILGDDFHKKEKGLRLVTNSRLSPEKGFERMLILVNLLKEKGVKFNWLVFGDNSYNRKEEERIKGLFSGIEEVTFVGYKSDVTWGLETADYLVQLSDFEGCPYSVLEALKMKVPCIVSAYLGSEELIQDGVNGYRLPLDMGKIDIDKVVNDIPIVKDYKLSTIKDWIKLLEEKHESRV